MKYAINIIKDADYWLLSIDELPSLTSIAYRLEDVQKECLDAFELMLDFYTENKQPIPLPKKAKKDACFLEIPTTLAAKIYLYNEWLNSGQDKKQLADKINIKQPQLSRLFNFKYKSKIEAIEQAFNALGKRFELKVS